MRNVAIGATLVLLLVLATTSCDKNDPTGVDTQYVEAVLTHMGFDFSAGRADTVTWQNNDGETINWQPDGGDTLIYPNFDAFIWWRNSMVSGTNRTKDMGAVPLSSVTSVDTSWDQASAILPLIPGHTIVAGCNDGYVKFQVISADTSWDGGLNLWPARVQYYFSATPTFDR